VAYNSKLLGLDFLLAMDCAVAFNDADFVRLSGMESHRGVAVRPQSSPHPKAEVIFPCLGAASI
jgi:hypothetical protein